MKTKKHISYSIAAITMAMLLLCSVVATVMVPHQGYVSKVEKQKAKEPVSQHINVSHEYAAVIPSFNVPFLSIPIDLFHSFEAVSLPLLFVVQPLAFVNSYLSNFLCHFISPRAP